MTEKNKYTYYYDRQLYRYILQFMSIFSVLQVSVGKRDDREPGLISVPIHYGSPDRVTAAILAQNTQNSPIRLPAMSAYLSDVDLAPELRKGVGAERRNVVVPVGGLLPDDAEVVYQRQPVPYHIMVELTVHVSNVDQQWQIMEQITTLFDPTITIQTSDNLFDPAKITSVELVNIKMDDATAQEDTRLIQTVYVFKIPVYLQLPSNIKHNIVETIKMRVGIVNSSVSISDDIVQQLDTDMVDYETILSAQDLTFD